MPGEGVAEVEPDRPGRLEHPRQLAADRSEIAHPVIDRSFQAELPGHAVVAQLEVRGGGEDTVDAGLGQLREARQDVARQDGVAG